MFIVAALQIWCYNQDDYYCYAADRDENCYDSCLWPPINFGAPAEVIHAGLCWILCAVFF